MSDRVPYFHICVTCRAGRELAEGEVPPGQILHDAVSGMAGADSKVVVRSVSCLSLCRQGCVAAISAPGKWGYLLGGLSDAVASDLMVYGLAYAASKTGTVLPSKRPASLETAVRARFPARELL